MNDFPFDITDVAAVLGMKLNSRNYTNCPLCGDNRGKMNLSLEKNVFRCNYCGESGGMIALYAKACGLSNADAYRSLLEATRNADFSAIKRECNKVYANRKQIQTASASEINMIYRALFSMFDLSPKHREHLMIRGLTGKQIERFGFKSVPVCGIDKHIHKLIEQSYTLQGVPGFYYDKDNQKWAMKLKCSGIVIPVTTVDGVTAGAQIRLDRPFNGCKYFWLSSSDMNMGASSGSPVGFVGDIRSKAVYVTEGYLKAVAAHCLSGLTFAAVAGVNNYGNLPALFGALKQNGVEEVVEAYDMDKLTNPHVERGCLKLVEIAREYGFKVRRIKWNGQFKGIDDYLNTCKGKAECIKILY